MEGTAKARYSELEPLREPYLRRARACSKFTLPSLIPPEGWTGSSDLPEPWNNLGARGVNNLSSKLLLALFPPGSSFFRNELDPKTVIQLEQEYGKGSDDLAGIMSEINGAMADVEKRVTTWMEVGQVRVSLGECLKHLIVAGNSLLFMPASGGLRVFRMDKFVVLRDPYGKVLEIITKECVARAGLPKAAQALLEDSSNASTEAQPASPTPEARQAAVKTVDLYTHVYLDGSKYRVYQEIVGKVVPQSKGSYPVEKTPWLPLRWTKIDGEDYGFGHVDSFLGDLSTLDMLSQALAEGSAAAARIIGLKKPGSTGQLKDLINARNGGFVEMEHDAVKFLQLEKHYDFRTALDRVQEIERSLALAFLLNSAIQRQGERVTAEEIRFMARELEDALGGVYSVFSQELQLPLVRRILFVMQQQKALPALPQDIQPVIITGIEALGRGNDLSRLQTWLQSLPQDQLGVINWDEYARRSAVALSVDTTGLIKSPEQIQMEQAQQQMAAMAQQMGPQAINALGGVAQREIDAGAKKEIANGKAAEQPAG